MPEFLRRCDLLSIDSLNEKEEKVRIGQLMFSLIFQYLCYLLESSTLIQSDSFLWVKLSLKISSETEMARGIFSVCLNTIKLIKPIIISILHHQDTYLVFWCSCVLMQSVLTPQDNYILYGNFLGAHKENWGLYKKVLFPLNTAVFILDGCFLANRTFWNGYS